MGLPVVPHELVGGATFSFAPAKGHATAGKGMFAPCGDHRCVGDRDACVGGKDLAFFLLTCVDRKGEAVVSAGVEFGQIVIQIWLADRMGVPCLDVLDECSKIHAVESFGGVIENGVVDVVDGCGKLVAGDSKDEFVRGPRLACNNVVGAQFFALGGSGGIWHDGVCWWFVGGNGERFPRCVLYGWDLEAGPSDPCHDPKDRKKPYGWQ